ncbi:MAG: serine hydrolase domain-containing protein [Pseudomonadota bacterium]
MTRASFSIIGAALLALASPTVSFADQAGATQANELQTAIGSTLSTKDVDRLITTLMGATDTPGVAVTVINNGSPVYDKVFGVTHVKTGEKITRSTTFEAASLSKPLTGFLAMTFVEEGLLDLDTPLHQYLPNKDLEFDPRYRKITARHVLSHQTGLPNWRTDDPDKGLFFKFAPGEGFFYSGEGYEYLADVLMHLAETDDAGLEALFQSRIANPLGMERTTFIAGGDVLCERATPHRDGTPIRMKPEDPTFGAAYSVHSDARDYARFAIGVLKGEILAPATYETFLAPQQSPIPADDPARAIGLTDWALGFSVYDTPAGRVFTHGGNNPGYSSLVVIHPERQWGAVVFTNADQANDFLQGLVLKLAGFDQ